METTHYLYFRAMRKTKKLRVYTLDQIKDEMIGRQGAPKREKYEVELRVDLLGKLIQSTRLSQNLTQAQLGALIGVQKAQISKLEKTAGNMTVETILKVFDALKAKVTFQIEPSTRGIRAR